MKINYINSINSYCSAVKNVNSNPIKQDVSFKGEALKPAYVSDWEMQQKYMKEIIDKYTTFKKDSEGHLVLDKRNNPIRVVIPQIKDALDNSVFEFEGPNGEQVVCSIKDIINMHAVDDESAAQSGCLNLFHGTSREAMQNILEKGPDMTAGSRTAFGPGMYFAFSEGDAHDYSSAKLLADVHRSERKDGTKGRFVRFKTDYYDKINGKCATKLRDLLGLNITDKDYSREVPYYIPMVKTEAPYKIFNDYCRDLIVNDLGIDAACGFSRGYHSCVVVFNPDSVCNLREYSPSAMSYGY